MAIPCSGALGPGSGMPDRARFSQPEVRRCGAPLSIMSCASKWLRLR
ncbi:hypothetical protein ROTAS13_03783 [Roseomonas sp. TAS13]|nr:hypothetical protein ROTAS13_03783 [Roseomonas sp. TAS13]